METASSPSRVNKKPRASPRAPEAEGTVHVVESPVGPERPVEPHAVVEAAPMKLVLSHLTLCGASMVSNSDMSDA